MKKNISQPSNVKQNHFSSAERQEILDKLLVALEEDQRIAGVLIVGSGVEGFEDIYSDIDLSVVIEEAQDVRPLFQDWGIKFKELLPVFYCGESVRGPNIYLWVLLLDNFIEVGASFLCLDDLCARRGRWKTVFDRSGRIEDIQQTSWANRTQLDLEAAYYRRVRWVWHYIIHATIAVQRKQWWRALYELEQVRNQAIELRGLRENLETKRFRYVDQMSQEFRWGMEQTLVTSLEASEIMRALKVAMGHFFQEAKHLDEVFSLDLAKRFEKKILEYLELFQ